jgi:diadenylate cyclase
MVGFLTAPWQMTLELILMAALAYGVWHYLRRASGVRLLGEIAATVLVLLTLAHLMNLQLIRAVALFIGVILVVIFQPEVRRAFVSLGSHRIFSTARENLQLAEVMEETLLQLSAKRIGALFAFERGMDLSAFVETGVEVDALFSTEVVLTIFHPKTALHDGGMILRQGRIQAAGCVFPVSQRELSNRSIGLRHRAALGISEQTDAIAVIVSEETGAIAICADGDFEQGLTLENLRACLKRHLSGRDPNKDREASHPVEAAATRRLEG